MLEKKRLGKGKENCMYDEIGSVSIVYAISGYLAIPLNDINIFYFLYLKRFPNANATRVFRRPWNAE